MPEWITLKTTQTTMKRRCCSLLRGLFFVLCLYDGEVILITALSYKLSMHKLNMALDFVLCNAHANQLLAILLSAQRAAINSTKINITRFNISVMWPNASQNATQNATECTIWCTTISIELQRWFYYRHLSRWNSSPQNAPIGCNSKQSHCLE